MEKIMTIEERRTALVFGGARGIGAAAVRKLAEDGFAVAFTYVSRPTAHRSLLPQFEEEGEMLSPFGPTAPIPKRSGRQ